MELAVAGGHLCPTEGSAKVAKQSHDGASTSQIFDANGLTANSQHLDLGLAAHLHWQLAKYAIVWLAPATVTLHCTMYTCYRQSIRTGVQSCGILDEGVLALRRAADNPR